MPIHFQQINMANTIVSIVLTRYSIFLLDVWLECLGGQNPVEFHNSIMELHNQFMELRKSIMELAYCQLGPYDKFSNMNEYATISLKKWKYRLQNTSILFQLRRWFQLAT